VTSARAPGHSDFVPAQFPRHIAGRSGDSNRYRPWRLEFSGDIVFISSGIPRYANYAVSR